jgi:hypothetical protein
MGEGSKHQSDSGGRGIMYQLNQIKQAFAPWMRKKGEKRTHDYTKQYWGWSCSITKIKADDHTICCLGHGHGLQEGDTMLLSMESGKVGRFTITQLKYFSDPKDMFDLEAVFDGYEPEKPDEKKNDSLYEMLTRPLRYL